MALRSHWTGPEEVAGTAIVSVGLVVLAVRARRCRRPSLQSQSPSAVIATQDAIPGATSISALVNSPQPLIPMISAVGCVAHADAGALPRTRRTRGPRRSRSCRRRPSSPGRPSRSARRRRRRGRCRTPCRPAGVGVAVGVGVGRRGRRRWRLAAAPQPGSARPAARRRAQPEPREHVGRARRRRLSAQLRRRARAEALHVGAALQALARAASRGPCRPAPCRRRAPPRTS